MGCLQAIYLVGPWQPGSKGSPCTASMCQPLDKNNVPCPRWRVAWGIPLCSRWQLTNKTSDVYSWHISLCWSSHICTKDSDTCLYYDRWQCQLTWNHIYYPGYQLGEVSTFLNVHSLGPFTFTHLPRRFEWMLSVAAACLGWDVAGSSMPELRALYIILVLLSFLQWWISHTFLNINNACFFNHLSNLL